MIKALWMSVFLNIYSCRRFARFGYFYLVFLHFFACFFHCMIFFCPSGFNIYFSVCLHERSSCVLQDWRCFTWIKTCRRFRQSAMLILLLGSFLTEQEWSALGAMGGGGDIPVKPTIKYQQFKSSSKVSEMWYEHVSSKTSCFFAARAVAFNFLGMNHLHQFSYWWGMNPFCEFHSYVIHFNCHGGTCCCTSAEWVTAWEN